MRIGIDARLVAKGRGLGEFAYQLIKHLPSSSDHQFFIYSYPQFSWNSAKLPSNFTIRHLPPSYVFSEQVVLPWLIRKDRLDVFHATTNTAPLWLPAGLKLILTIHDAMFLSDKQRIPVSTSWYQRLGRKYYAFISKRIISRADILTTISQFSQRDIAEGFNINPQAIRVIYEGVGPEFKPNLKHDQALKKYDISKPYFLHLGAIDPRKQTLFTIQSFGKYIEKFSGKSFQLVISGIPSHQSQAFLDLIDALQLQERVKLVGFVSKQELVALMSGARALVFPSLYEGFGLPMLQAMACRCPIISTSSSSLPEVGGKGAVYIEPGNSQQLADQLIEMSTSDTLRKGLIDEGQKQVSKFSWKITADSYMLLYQEVAIK